MGLTNSKEKEKMAQKEVIKNKLIKSIKKEQEEEEKEQINHIIDLSFASQSTGDLQKIAEEKSRQGSVSCYFESIRENNFHVLKQFDKELRTRYDTTSAFPYSVHGIVRADLGNGTSSTGTGVLIGPDLVLTAAHNIYAFLTTKEKYPVIQFIPGMNGEAAPFGVFNVVETYVSDEYLKTWEQEDYALLVLNGTPGVQAGYFGLHIAEKEFFKRIKPDLNVIGYPRYVKTKDDEIDFLGKGRHQLWGMRGKSWLIDDTGNKNGEFLIHYDDILTTLGQSGSGVFYQEEGTSEYYVIGVHVLGGEGKGSYNSGTWITKKRFDQIEKWISGSRKRFFSQKIKNESQNGKVDVKKLNLKESKIGDVGVQVFSGALEDIS